MKRTTRIKKGDTVIAVAGKERFSGKTGRVLKVLPQKGRALVEGLNIVKRHMRPTQENPKGGIVEREASIPLSNLMLYCDKCRRGVRIGRRILSDGTRVRFCKKCDEVIGSG